MGNPYDGYDIYDPWDDDEADDTGNFDFVEDEYDSIDNNVPQRVDGTQAMTQTQVRPNYDVPTYDTSVYDPPAYDESPYDAPGYEAPAKGGFLHRRREKKRGRKPEPYVANAPRPMGYVPAYERDYQEEPAPRKHRRRRRFGCLPRLLIMIVAIVGLYWLVAHPIDEKLAFSPQEQATLNGATSFAIPGTPYYALLLGSDAREGEDVSRTDSMLLARIDFWAGKITLVSIPRDTKVEIAGYGTNKINAAYAFGGVGGAVRAVSQLTGVPIHHAAVIHFEELADLINYLGGVTVNVPESLSDPYTELELDAGLQTMDGETAVLWARSRYGYEDGDYQRQEDQRILLAALMNRMLSLSPFELPGLLSHAGDLVGTDLRCYDLIPLLARFMISHPEVYSCALPTTSAYEDDTWYEVTDTATVQQFMNAVNEGRNPSI